MNTAAVQAAIDNYYYSLDRERYRYYLGNFNETPPAWYEAVWQFVAETKNIFFYVTEMAYFNTITAVWKEPEPIPFLRVFYADMFDAYGMDREMSPAEMLQLFKFLYIERGTTDWEEQLPVFALQVEEALGGRENILTLLELRRQRRLTQDTFDRVVYPNKRIPVRLLNGHVVLLAPDGLPSSLAGRELSYNKPNELKPAEEVEIEDDVASENESEDKDEFVIEIEEQKYSDDEEQLVMVVPQRDSSVRLVYQEKGSSKYAPTMFAGSISSATGSSASNDSHHRHPVV